MKPLSLCLIILASLTFNFSKAIQNRYIPSSTSAQDSIYKVWKFMGVDFVKGPKTAEFTCPVDIDMNNYDILGSDKKRRTTI